MKLKKALIFGITGQDGSYLSKYLLKKKYKVHGISRGKNFSNLKKLNILKKIKIYTLKKNSKNNIKNILKKNFNEIYFLGGQSNVLESFKIDYETYLSQVSPVSDILNFILLQKGRKTKFLFAGSCEMFGKINGKKKISENDKKKPQSPYGLSKYIGYEIIKTYRQMFNLPVCTAILFNHESNLRTNKYVFKKIIDSVKKININSNFKLNIGNINIKRDWGWAPEYMEACNKILNSNRIDDYIIATGKSVSLKKIIDLSFKRFKLDWKKFTKVNKTYFRRFEIYQNQANINKLKTNIDWEPKKNYLDIIKELTVKEN